MSIEASSYRASPALLAGKSEFCLPWTVQVDNLPVPFGDALRVKESTRNYLPCDRQCGHTDAVRFQVSAEHCRGRPESRLAEGNGRKGRDRVVGEPAPGDEDGPEAGGPHGRGVIRPARLRPEVAHGVAGVLSGSVVRARKGMSPVLLVLSSGEGGSRWAIVGLCAVRGAVARDGVAEMPGDRLHRILAELSGGGDAWSSARLCGVCPGIAGVTGAGV